MPFQSEKQKKWMWANKPEMAREWTQEYGSKIKAKAGIMATDKNWIQKATKNMRKDKPCTGDKFGGPTCPKGSRRYNLAKTFKKMNKAGGGPIKANKGISIKQEIDRRMKDETPRTHFLSKFGKLGMLRRHLHKKRIKKELKDYPEHLSPSHVRKAGGGPIKAGLGTMLSKVFRRKGTAHASSSSSQATGDPRDKLLEYFKSKHSAKKGKMIKAKHGKYIPIPTPHADIAKYVTKRGVVEGPQGEDTFWRRKDSTMKTKKKGAGPKGGVRKVGIGKGKKPKILIINPEQGIKLWNKETGWKESGDEAKGGQGFTPGWKPQLSVRTANTGVFINEPPKWISSGGKRRAMGAHPKKSSGPKKINKEWLEWKYKTKLAGGGPIKAKKGSLLTTGLKGYDVKKVSSKTHQKFMKLFKHREVGGWKEAKGYKKHLKALGKMQKAPLSGMSKTLPPKTARLLTNLKFAYKDKSKARTLSAAKTLPRHVKFLGTAGKVAAVGYGLAAAYQAGKRNLLSKENLQKGAMESFNKHSKSFNIVKKKKVQKKSTGGEIIIGRGVDLDLL